MPSRLTPPTFPLRKADDNSQFTSTGLVLAYPMLEGGGSIVRNHGSWGSAADLTLTGATWTKRETGMSSLNFASSTAVAKNTSMARIIPSSWTWAAWIKVDTTPTSTPKEIFSFRTAAGVQQVRVWADSTGIWSWQKSATADDYSVLSPSYFPTTGPMLIISTFAGNNLAPVQLATNIGMRSIPTQPVSYAAFNVGSGAQANTLDGFYLGNDHANAAPWDGTIGPFYFWNRVLTNSEVWQMWQDPYSPFRRNTGEYFAPAMMRTTSGFSLNGLGKTSGPKTIIQDQNSLFIVVDDYYFYQELPQDNMTPVAEVPNTITIGTDYEYSRVPIGTDALSPPEFLNQIIFVDETYNYTSATVTITDSLTGDGQTPLTITIIQDFNTPAYPDDVLTGSADGPLNITVGENFTQPMTTSDTSSSVTT